MATRRIGVGLIGLGMVASAHARSLQDLSDIVDVRGVYSRDDDKRNAFAAQFGFPPASSVEALIADPALDMLIVITPPNARLDIVAAAAKAGKHLLVEKPLERTSEAAHHIVTACESAGVRLGVMFQERLREQTRKLSEIIRDGALGGIVAGQFIVPWWRPQTYYDTLGRGTYARDGGGVLITQAIHTLDLMLHFMGPVDELAAIAGTTALHRMEAEDTVTAGVRFKSGAIGTVWATTASFPGGPEAVTVDFERGSARLAAGTLVISHHDGRTETFGHTKAKTGGGADPMAFPHFWHRDVIRDFVEAIRDDRPPSILGTEAFEVHLVIDALVRSSRERRAIRFDDVAAPFRIQK